MPYIKSARKENECSSKSRVVTRDYTKYNPKMEARNPESLPSILEARRHPYVSPLGVTRGTPSRGSLITTLMPVVADKNPGGADYPSPARLTTEGASVQYLATIGGPLTTPTHFYGAIYL